MLFSVCCVCSVLFVFACCVFDVGCLICFGGCMFDGVCCLVVCCGVVV